MRTAAEGADVVVAGAQGRPGVAVPRALARRGIRPLVLGDDPNGMVSASRVARPYVRAPSPQEEPERFFELVRESAARARARVVMPMSDPALAVCSRYRAALPPGVRLAAAPAKAVENVLDKRRNLETARRLGIPCPVELSPAGGGQGIRFPLVLKNAAVGERGPSLKWAVARDAAELEAALARFGAGGQPPLCQELVEGTVRNLCCFAARGEVVALHEYWTIRRLAWDGAGVYREIAPPTPTLEEHARRLLRALEWEGVAHVGFIVRPDGEPRYMETNGRFWGSLQGSISIGWNFPVWTYRYFADGRLPEPPPLRVGDRSCWHHGDLRLLASRLRRREPPTERQPGAARAVLEFLAGFRPGVHPDVFSWRDPLPAAVELWSTFRDAIGRRAAAAAEAPAPRGAACAG